MKTAIVTGASSGIGLEISKVLINHGYKVYGFGRDFSKTNYQNELFIPIICDLMDINKLCEIIKEIRKSNEIHILVNNAGIGYFGPHEELNPKKIHEMVITNLEVPLVLTQQLLRDLKKNKGFVINISSITAKKSSTYGCAYSATKAGLTHFANSLFDETRKYGVKVVTIHPDITKTNFYRNANFKESNEEDTYITPEEVANAINFVLMQREGIVINEITLKPQKHKIDRK
ncbi:SDR family oxidoreductase [Thermobrachium celere]|uniref:3-oxoacyl-[acyl-carrier protein] reductase n=1 Tax=Thermobrachium celere DSM 8682 TaxID=941824 RepID=R7RQQ7_9CLOT|nr:SDR family NAD(P)-dependent oxidoreductase [Thermobrachium celere]CDF58414.1 3-oxoacyl-[acyl-carrier protein] reductase [Thermobrachium celere DSM 8682]